MAASVAARCFLEPVEHRLAVRICLTERDDIIGSGRRRFGAVKFNAQCNVNFLTGMPGPHCKAWHWTTANAPETFGGQHTIYSLKAGVREVLYAPRGFMGVVHPSNTGLALIVHEPDTAAHVSFEWHEK